MRQKQFLTKRNKNFYKFNLIELLKFCYTTKVIYPKIYQNFVIIKY